ncbi:hypothetical protein DFQ04_0967 [Algoriphagus boseongensis]|uniref:Uncharacterized protein n=1 Tax=Algoriphagus boseongensis TaxID=1442587 RepID=A0A4R6T7Y8_9BACT|nr:hypothetical protein [Algoriphagus boseongensis]TDQ19150.1 hypothetical protein DFQ04_0967 [Algoriphagus boseongensis]
MKLFPLTWIAFLFISVFPEDLIKENPYNQPLENNPTVRESTVDLQVRVGEKLYVFGKAQGTLDKVKVGMHVLPFSQNQKIEGIHSDFHQVTWKRLKDGSIQIQSTYKPWPALLTWLVLPDGRLKMEATSANTNGRPLDQLGLGFDFPEEELKKIAVNNQEIGKPEQNSGFNSFTTAWFEFDYVKLLIRSELSGLALNTHFATANSSHSDLVISFPSVELNPAESNSPGPNPGAQAPARAVSTDLNKMILWFDFH